MAWYNNNQRGVTNVKTSETTGCQRGTELYFSKSQLAGFLLITLADFLPFSCPSAASTYTS
jgi:hypothetical protein